MMLSTAIMTKGQYLQHTKILDIILKWKDNIINGKYSPSLEMKLKDNPEILFYTFNLIK